MTELSLRVFSGIVLFLIFCFMTWVGPWGLSFLGIVCLVLLLKEWGSITSGLFRWGPFFWFFLGILSFIWMVHYSIPWVLFILSTVFTTDIASYFGGKALGGAQMAPAISPKKTMGGFFSGLTAALALSFLWDTPFSFSTQVALSFIIANASVAGDLLESFLKRRCGVKDSGSLLPGHGGLADRLDSALFVFPLMVFLALPPGNFSLFKISLTKL